MISLRKASLWAAILAVSLCAGSQYASAMSFRLARADFVHGCARSAAGCPTVIVATGDISENSAEELLAFIARGNPKAVTRNLFIHSAGGSLFGSLKLGLFLRVSKANVFVGRIAEFRGRTVALSGGCMSGCVLALMGGSKRFIVPESKIGIHRGRLPGPGGDGVMAVLLGQRKLPDYATGLRLYAKKMGINPEVVDMSERVSANSIRILSTPDVVRLRLAQVAN